MTTPPPHLEREEDRVRELHRYGVLDTGPEAAFDRIVNLAQRIFAVPTVLISLVDENRQWFKARCGLANEETGLEVSFCAHAIRQDGVFVVLDATQDPRFAENELVVGEPFIRFYAGAPLTTPSGYNLGTLCLIDAAPHAEFDKQAQATLRDLAALVVDELELRLATQESQEQAARNRVVLESITEAFYTVDAAWRFTYLNTQAETVLKRSRAELLGTKLWEQFPGTVGSALQAQYERAVTERTTVIFEYFDPPLDIWFEVHAYPSSEGLSVYFQDISARKKAERKARVQDEFRKELLELTQISLQEGLSEGFYQNLLESAVKTVPGAQTGSILKKENGRYHYVAAVGFELGALQRCTFSPDDYIFGPNNCSFDLGNPEPQFVYAWQAQKLDEDRRRTVEEHGHTNDIKVSLCVPLIFEGESKLSLHLDNFDFADAFDGEAVEMTRVFVQQAAALMQRLELEAKLRCERTELKRLARRDALTGLPNRLVFDERLEQALAQADRSTQGLAVMFLDLDNFKYVNDTYGHGFGDALLRAVAARIAPSLRVGDTLARWGGDEFVLLLSGLAGADEVARVANRLLELLRRPFELSGVEVRTGASIGISIYQEGSANAEALVKHADIALYRAKAVRGSFQIFTEQMNAVLRKRVALGEELRAALEKGVLTPHYQPRVDLATGRVTSFEALARWPHPTRGWVSPGEFIPLAEAIGLIRPLGAQMLTAACAQAGAWQRAGTPYRVAVNLSVEQLKHPEIVAEVKAALRRAELDPRWLELEITESTAMTDVEGSIGKLRELRELGVHLSVDDFGTAYSSLAYLKRLPVHSLKIDRSFIHDLGCDHGPAAADTSIVQAILALGRSLGLEIVAEGVETPAQRELLLELGCAQAQGYLFARPVSAAEVGRLLAQGRLAPPAVLSEVLGAPSVVGSV